MNVEIGTEATQFLEKEYIRVNGILVAAPHQIDANLRPLVYRRTSRAPFFSL